MQAKQNKKNQQSLYLELAEEIKMLYEKKNISKLRNLKRSVGHTDQDLMQCSSIFI